MATSVLSVPLDPPGGSQDESLEALQRRYEKVKAEKERLSKLQELGELEEQLRSQIEERVSGHVGMSYP
jgi:hypothetical protein